MERIENTSNNSIVDGVIWKGLLKFFFPIMLGTLFQQLYNTVDAVVVGKFVGTQALAAVGGSSSQIVNLFIGFFVGLSSGATVIVSQYFGAREDEGVSRAVHTAMALAFIAGALMTVVGLVFAPAMLEMMNTTEDTMADSTLYLRIVFLSMIPSMVYNVGSSILRAIGDSRSPLYFLAAACLVNVVLDLAFVLIFHMGVAGVAIATSIAQAVSAVLVFVALCRAKGSYRVIPRQDPPGARAAGAHGAHRPAHGPSVGALRRLQHHHHDLASTASAPTPSPRGSRSARSTRMFWLILSAFGVAIMTFVGQNYGARKFDRVHKSLKVALAIACGHVDRVRRGAAAGWTVCLPAVHKRPDRHGRRHLHDDVHGARLCALRAHRTHQRRAARHGRHADPDGHHRGRHLRAARAVDLRRRSLWHDILAITISYPISWLLTSAAFILYYARVRRKLLPVREREQ